jgi:surface protein
MKNILILSFLSIVFFSCIEEDPNNNYVPKIYLHDNGVTIKCEDCKVGDKAFVDGIEYEVVDNDLLYQRNLERVDMTKLCTSLVTDMSELFSYRDFNEPIGNWDVSNVTNMARMFKNFENSQFNQSLEFWDVSKVTNMSEMFRFSKFNQPIGK